MRQPITANHRRLSETRAVGLIGVLGLALLGVNLYALHSVADDAFISFRYLDNWLTGHGLVFNPGERVEGYTNFLWILLLAPCRALGLQAEVAAVLLSIIALLALLWAVFGTARRVAADSLAGWAAMLLIAGSLPVARWAVSGMETVAFAALLALANERLAACQKHTLSSSTLFGLATLMRPEGLLFAVVAFATALVAEGRRRAPSSHRLAAVLVFLAFPLAHLVFRWAYYGAPLPNTFYAKLAGDLPMPLAEGLGYLGDYVVTGGFAAAGCALLALRSRLLGNWVVLSLAMQTVVYGVYVARVGGDYFPFHRFIVPTIPMLATLGGIGWWATLGRREGGRRRPALVAVLLLSLLASGVSYRSSSWREFTTLLEVRHEREMIAEWLAARLGEDVVLAVNAAGVIPYRTRVRTIDMLGLNDAHIARAPVATTTAGYTKVGHFRHDGEYVCRRRPDVVLTAGAALHRGRSADEAVLQAALNTFPGDREFLQAVDCRGRYRPRVEELLPGKFVVAYLRAEDHPVSDASGDVPDSANEWFDRGLALMREARLLEAAEAFERSLQLAPRRPSTLTNLGFCLVDLQRYAEAVSVFERALQVAPSAFDALYGLAQSYERLGRREEAVALWRRYIALAPDSVWKERAEQHLRLLGERVK